MAIEVQRQQTDGTHQPRFSIVMAVHNTAEFLPQCVESLLSQSFEDFELIAVDDASSDDSQSLLSRYAFSDPRVKTLQLEVNVGSGGARNAGMAQARGKYIWFVDSDDWVDRASLAKIAGRLDETDADVLLFGWSRHFPDGEASACPAASHLEAAPATFALHEWPRAIRVLHTPWNKVVRRDLIERVGFSFPSGKYQDLPYTYSMLAAATRISTLPDVLVHYRKQRSSSSMTTSCKGHLAVLQQWASVFQLVATHSSKPETLQLPLFDRMAWHLLLVIRRQSVPQEHWKEYFQGVEDLWASHCPVDYRFPRNLIGLRYRMMAGKLPFASLIPLAALAGVKLREVLGRRPVGRIAGAGGDVSLP